MTTTTTSTTTTTLHLLCCTANMGNAPPTAKDVAAWIPAAGTRLDNDNNDNSHGECYDMIVIGMQEATWKSKKDKKGHVIAVAEENDNDDDDDEEAQDYAKLDGTQNLVVATTPSDLSERSTSVHSTTTSSPTSLHSTPNNSNHKKSSTRSTSNDSLLLRNLLTKQINPTTRGEHQQQQHGYKLHKEFQRGQMRLYLFVRQDWVKEIKHLEVKAENTGIAGVYHNKGGIVVQFTLCQTRITIVTAHLAAHEGAAPYKARNESVREILRGARPHPKHLLGLDAALVSHHMLVMGDLNYRVRIPVDNNNSTSSASSAVQAAQVERALALIRDQDLETLYGYDELTAAIQQSHVLCQFQTLPCHFSPTFKVLRQEGFHYKTQRIPSYTDRILFTSAEHLTDKLKALTYEPCPDFAASDHKPIRGAFAIQLNGTTATTQKAKKDANDVMTEPVSLTFRNMKCQNLPAMDVDGSSDPYVMFVCDPVDLVQDDRNPKDRKQQGTYKWPRTAYLQKTLNPEWNEQVKLCIPAVPASRMNGAMLFVTIMDYDLSTADDTISTLALNLQQLVSLGGTKDQERKTVQIDRPLLKYGRQQGMIQCTIDVQRGGIENADKHVKKRGGFLSNLSKRLSFKK